MSVKFSNSPALHLIVGKSRIHRGLQLTLCLCVACSLYLLYDRGYPLLALGLAPILCLLPWYFSRGPAVAQLRWRRGVWQVERAGDLQAVEVCATTTCLSWLIYFAWREPSSGERGALWLFADSASPAALRQLRVRLALQR